MLISDAAKRVLRVRAEDSGTGVWDFGTAVWVTDGTCTKLITAAHTFGALGFPMQCRLSVWSQEYGASANVRTDVIYANPDTNVDFARLLPDGIAPPVDPFHIDLTPPPHVAAVGYPVSANKLSTGALGPPDIRREYGSFIGRRPTTGTPIPWDVLLMDAQLSHGYSGGPLFPLDGGLPAGATIADDLPVRNSVLGICQGVYGRAPNATAFASIALFRNV